MISKDYDILPQLMKMIPKVELHLHIEGALPLATLFRLMQRAGNTSVTSLRQLQELFRYSDFDHFIELWTWKNTFIREEADFSTIIYEVLEMLAEQNVKYVEGFYTPGDYRRAQLSAAGITEALLEGIHKAEKRFPISCQLIVDLCRDYGPDFGAKLLDELSQYLHQGLVGVGIGGSEHLFPPEPYEAVFREARRRGFHLTAHAGEVMGAESIWGAIEHLGVERIGHGTRAYEDPELVALLAKDRIPLEMCVQSNVKTGVCSSVQAHPFRAYFDSGLLVTINSDDPTMFGTTLTDEYLTLHNELSFSLTELKQISINAIHASFLSDIEKQALLKTFEQEWQLILTAY